MWIWGKVKSFSCSFPFLCAVLFRGAESLRVRDCDLVSGMANVTDKGSRAAFSLLLFHVSLACKTELSLLLNYAVFLSVSQAYMKILTWCRTSK